MTIGRRERLIETMGAYALLITEDEVPSTHREGIPSSELVFWERAMGEEMQSLTRTIPVNFASCPKVRRRYVANEFIKRIKDLHDKTFGKGQDW